METEMIHTLTATFEAHAQQTENGVEFWLARDLQHLLGYAEWRNFSTVISKAKTACEVSGHPIGDHFVDVNKMVDLGSESSNRNPVCLQLKRSRRNSVIQQGTPEMKNGWAKNEIRAKKQQFFDPRVTVSVKTVL